MPRKGNHTHCRECGEPLEVVGLLSTRGYCPPCGKRRRDANNEQLQAHSGPFFERWRRRGIAGYGGIVPQLDAATADEHNR